MNDFPRLAVLPPGVLVKVNSQKELDDMRAADIRAMKWGIGLGVAVPAVVVALTWPFA